MATDAANADVLSYPFVAAGAMLGVTLGSFFALIYMMIRHRRHGTGLQVSREEYAAAPRPRSSRAIFRALMAIAIPVALGSLATQVTNLIDAVSLQWCLKTVIADAGETVRGIYQGLFDPGLQADQFQSWLVGMPGNGADLC